MHVEMNYKKMTLQFHREYNTAKSLSKNTNRSPLFNVDRGLGIAKNSRSERSIAKLHVTNQAQVNSLARFGSHAKFLTNNLAAIDFTSRSAGIITTAKNEGDWHKEMFIESLSFAASTRGATFVGQVGMGLVRTLPMVVALTPLGIVLLIGVGLVTTGSAIAINNWAKSNGENWYDDIISWIQ